MSKDGLYRFDLRVTHRVGRATMATALASAYRDHDIFEDGPLSNLSRAKVLATVKEVLHDRGTDFLEGWSDHLTEAETESMWDWAIEQVGNAFPELEPSSEGQR
ncbi:hypothetical protein KME66_14745 [Streptomyces sp. YPW6]|uniref:hypothetical protein n=1 Tax=Streptomyces sp. YPW6 TaxID=2840373 RepID=UPI001C0D64FE|nr:hypothetical protein [Streptomyces sp. YPW6]QWQ42128.1 hypothetical protein KME66_14745 [Streptomyces sp. YPW6]